MNTNYRRKYFSFGSCNVLECRTKKVDLSNLLTSSRRIQNEE